MTTREQQIKERYALTVLYVAEDGTREKDAAYDTVYEALARYQEGRP